MLVHCAEYAFLDNKLAKIPYLWWTVEHSWALEGPPIQIHTPHVSCSSSRICSLWTRLRVCNWSLFKIFKKFQNEQSEIMYGRTRVRNDWAERTEASSGIRYTWSLSIDQESSVVQSSWERGRIARPLRTARENYCIAVPTFFLYFFIPTMNNEEMHSSPFAQGRNIVNRLKHTFFVYISMKAVPLISLTM